MSRNIHKSLALLRRIEIPSRPLEWTARHILVKVMNTLSFNRRIICRTLLLLAEHFRVLYQFSLQPRRNLRALGHNIINQNIIFLCDFKGLFQILQPFRIDTHRLICQNIQPRLHTRLDILGLFPVITADNNHIPRPFFHHPLEEIAAPVNLCLPARRIIASIIKSVYLL